MSLVDLLLITQFLLHASLWKFSFNIKTYFTFSHSSTVINSVETAAKGFSNEAADIVCHPTASE